MTDVLNNPTATDPSQTPSQAPVAADLATAAQHVLAASPEPLTLSKIRTKLPAPYREVELNELAEVLKRQAAAGSLHAFPPYRSTQERYWDRPMTTHVASLLRSALAETPLAWSELRRRLPAYARSLGQAVLDSQLAQGLLHRHPRVSARGPEKLGVRPADARDYLRTELPVLFRRLSELGFTPAQLRAAALELLHEEEWDVLPPAGESETPKGEASAAPVASSASSPAMSREAGSPATPASATPASATPASATPASATPASASPASASPASATPVPAAPAPVREPHLFGSSPEQSHE